MPISTRILDATTGRPAAGVRVSLDQRVDGGLLGAGGSGDEQDAEAERGDGVHEPVEELHGDGLAERPAQRVADDDTDDA